MIKKRSSVYTNIYYANGVTHQSFPSLLLADRMQTYSKGGLGQIRGQVYYSDDKSLSL